VILFRLPIATSDIGGHVKERRCSLRTPADRRRKNFGNLPRSQKVLGHQSLRIEVHFRIASLDHRCPEGLVGGDQDDPALDAYGEEHG